MGWTSPQEHYTRSVKGTAGEEATVTFRVLNAGDRVEINSKAAKVIATNDDEQRGEIDMAVWQFASLRRAIVSWDIPLPVSEASLKQLDSSVFDQLSQYVSFDGIPDEEEESSPLGAGADAHGNDSQQSA